MILNICFGLNIYFKVYIDEYTSWRDIIKHISSKFKINISLYIKHLIYKNKFYKENDDFIEYIENETLYITLHEKTPLNITDILVDSYNMIYPRITISQNIIDYLTILYQGYIESLALTLTLASTSASTSLASTSTLTSTSLTLTLTTEQLLTLRENSKEYKDILYPYGDKYTICPISHEEFSDSTNTIQLKCGHYFISDSILYWLQNFSTTCPTCRVHI